MIGATSAIVGVAHVDLHAHSLASDGACAPSEVIAAAHRAGVLAIALTDHDTIAGVEEAEAAGERIGIRVVAGVELSAVENDRETHLLGLHLVQRDGMEERLIELRAARRRRGAQTVEALNALGVTITLDDVMQQADGGAIGRPHVARALVAAGWVPDVRAAFDRFLGAGRPACIAKEPFPMRDAIALVHEAGGLAVLAHPGREGTRDWIESLANAGLDGIEVRHPSHSAEDVARLAALCAHYDLVPSGGSDWHGATEGPRLLGSQRVPADWLGRQDARVSTRRAQRPA